MEDTTFDDLVRRLTLVRMSRMVTIRGMAGSIPAALTAAVLAGEESSARKKHRKKKKKRRRSEPDTTTTTPAPTTTTPPVTTTTTTSTTPPPGACTVEQNSCVETVACNGKPDCFCWIRPAAIVGVDTPFCGSYGQCFDCSNDIECEGAFGAGWVCLNATGPHCEYCEVNYNGRQCAPPCGP